MPHYDKHVEHQKSMRRRDDHIGRPPRHVETVALARKDHDASNRAPCRKLTVQNLLNHTRYNKATETFNIGRYLATLKECQPVEQPSALLTVSHQDAQYIHKWPSSVLPPRPAKIEVATVDGMSDETLRRPSKPAQTAPGSLSSLSSSMVESMTARRSLDASDMNQTYVKNEIRIALLKPSRPRKQPGLTNHENSRRRKSDVELKNQSADERHPPRKRKHAEVELSTDRKQMLEGRRERRESNVIIVKNCTKAMALSQKAKAAFKLEEAERRGILAARAKLGQNLGKGNSGAINSLHKTHAGDISSVSISLSDVREKRCRRRSQARNVGKSTGSARRDMKQASRFVEPLSRASNIGNIPRLTVGLKSGIYKHGVASKRTSVQEKAVVTKLKDLAFDEGPFLNHGHNGKQKQPQTASSMATTTNGRREAQLSYQLPARHHRRHHSHNTTSQASASLPSAETTKWRSPHKLKQQRHHVQHEQTERRSAQQQAQRDMEYDREEQHRRNLYTSGSAVDLSEVASTGLSAASISRMKASKAVAVIHQPPTHTNATSTRVETGDRTTLFDNDDMLEAQWADIEAPRGLYDAAYIAAVTRKDEFDHGPYAIAGQAYMALPKIVESRACSKVRTSAPVSLDDTHFMIAEVPRDPPSDAAAWHLSSPHGMNSQTHKIKHYSKDKIDNHAVALEYQPQQDAYENLQVGAKIVTNRYHELDRNNALFWNLPLGCYSPAAGSSIKMDTGYDRAVGTLADLPCDSLASNSNVGIVGLQQVRQNTNGLRPVADHELQNHVQNALINVDNMMGWDSDADPWEPSPQLPQSQRFPKQDNLIQIPDCVFCRYQDHPSMLACDYHVLVGGVSHLHPDVPQAPGSHAKDPDCTGSLHMIPEHMSHRASCTTAYGKFPVFEALMDVRDVLNGHDRKQATYQAFWKKSRT